MSTYNAKIFAKSLHGFELFEFGLNLSLKLEIIDMRMKRYSISLKYIILNIVKYNILRLYC